MESFAGTGQRNDTNKPSLSNRTQTEPLQSKSLQLTPITTYI